jgi:hypothetical protein
VRVQLVDLLLADVGEVVLADLRGVQRERRDAAEVFEVFGRDLNLRQGRDRELENLLVTVAAVVEDEAGDAKVLARNLPAPGDALRNSLSFCVKARMMRSTSSGEPERLTTDGPAAAGVVAGVGFCAAAEAAQSRTARTGKRTLLINSLLNFRC